MKKVFNISILMAFALLFTLSSCISESITPDPTPVNGYDGGLFIRFNDDATTRGTTANTPPTFNEGYLLVVSGSTISRVYNIHTVAVNHNLVTRQLYIGTLRDFGVVLPPVPGSTTRLVVIGNPQASHTSPTAGMPIAQIEGQEINILSQHARENLNLWGQALRADWNPPAGPRTYYIAQIDVFPTVARIEMQQIDTALDSQIRSFTVEAIFIDRHYYDAHVGGFIPGAGVAPTLTPTRTNFVSRGDGTTAGFLFQSGSFGYTDAAGALFDTFSPALTSTTSIAAGTSATVLLTGTNRWAYNLFAMQRVLINPSNPPMPPNISSQGTRKPHIIIRLSDVRLRDGGAGTPLPLPLGYDYHYLTISRLLYDGNELTGIHALNVYSIVSLLFHERNLSLYPNENPFDANVRITLAHWNEQETYRPGFTQPNPVNVDLGLAPLTGLTYNTPLGVAVHGSCGVITYLWQRSIVTNPNPGNPAHWAPAINVAASSATQQNPNFTGLMQTTYFRRVAFACGDYIVSVPARVSIIPPPPTIEDAGAYVTTYVGAMYDFQEQRFYTIFDTTGGAVALHSWQWQWATSNSASDADWTNIADGLGYNFTAPAAVGGVTHHHASWTLPANFIWRDEFAAVRAAAPNNRNLYFRTVITDHNGVPRTQSAGNRFRIRFVLTTTDGTTLIPGAFGMMPDGVTRFAIINRAPSGTMRVALLNVGAMATDGAGGLGSLFQWGRTGTDTHHHVGWTTRYTDRTVQFDRQSLPGNDRMLHITTPGTDMGTSMNNARTGISFTQHQATSAAHINRFITGFADWGTGNHNKWGRQGNQATSQRSYAPNAANEFEWTYPEYNPCPAGWRVPSRWEWNDLHNGTGVGDVITGITGTAAAWTDFSTARTNWQWFTPQHSNQIAGAAIITNTAGNNAATIILPAAGIRDFSDGGTLNLFGFIGYYWSSTWSWGAPAPAHNLTFSGGAVWAGAGAYNRAYGFSVRCVQ